MREGNIGLGRRQLRDEPPLKYLVTNIKIKRNGKQEN